MAKKCFMLGNFCRYFLLKGWYKVHYDVLLPCVCQRCKAVPIDQRTAWAPKDVETAAAQEKSSLVCQLPANANFKNLTNELKADMTVALADLAPDIVMSDLSEYKINFDEIKVKEQETANTNPSNILICFLFK